MRRSGRFSGFQLIHLLLLVTTAELAFNRLATAEFRPVGESPPWWHQTLDHFGLFCHYFASTLAIGLIGHMLWRILRGGDSYDRGLRWGMATTGGLFLLLAVLSVAMSPGEELSFWFESSFVAVLLVLLVAQARGWGDRGTRIGIAFLVVPLVVHYYGPFAFHVLGGGESFDLPERVRHVGQWAMVLAALVSPYCFAPRPFMQSAARLGPFAIAMFVSVISVVIVRQHYEEGMRLAQQGLGVSIGPGAPAEYLALYLVALGTIVWTLTACLTADAVARRDIGVSLGLIVVGGYAFAWPLQYLVGLVGLLSMSRASRRVAHEERPIMVAPIVRAPFIAKSVWDRYIAAVSRALLAGAEDHAGTARPRQQAVALPDPVAPASPASRQAMPGGVDRERSGRAAGYSIDNTSADRLAGASFGVVPDDLNREYSGDHAGSVTCLVALRRGIEVTVMVERQAGSITCLEVLCGEQGTGEPQWTLYARPERLLAIGSHPEPPDTSAPPIRIHDPPFEDRFRIRDAGGLTETLLDEGMRARATALIDGWVAFWPNRGLRYRVEPGHGAPLDHPIPITELAFRGIGVASPVDRLITVIDFLIDMARNGLLGGTK